MGWLNDNAPGHEGWLVALIRDEEHGLARNDYFRELYLGDMRSMTVLHMQVGCDCGWRSPRMPAPPSATWHPCILCVDDATEERCRLLWRRHLRAELGLGLDDDLLVDDREHHR